MSTTLLTDPPSNPLSCSFCGKSQHKVRKLIAGPECFICELCVDICAAIVDEGAASRKLRLAVFEAVSRHAFPGSSMAETVADAQTALDWIMSRVEAPDGVELVPTPAEASAA